VAAIEMTVAAMIMAEEAVAAADMVAINLDSLLSL